jgi:ABC-type glycerol-3-phosphate transport system permease component
VHPTLEHIKYLFNETLFGTWMLNTLFISAAATAISLLCGLLAGYALSRLKFPFAGGLGTGIFITYLVPQTLLYQSSNLLTRNRPVPTSDGHNLPRLVDERVPRIAAVIYDVVVGAKDPV